MLLSQLTNYNEHVTPSSFVLQSHPDSATRKSLKAGTKTNGMVPAPVDAEKENVKPQERDSTESTATNFKKMP
jgi:hypothetical protein